MDWQNYLQSYNLNRSCPTYLETMTIIDSRMTEGKLKGEGGNNLMNVIPNWMFGQYGTRNYNYNSH